ncbi:MAG: dTDP-glucose 4,6-dehydratase [Anaerolineaceae bacterium]|nr:dTDP-glucose 4,6-dehydratase [Anaerolineaceae bacterium]
MRNVLVTGGAGFIGSNFVRYALTHHHSFRVINLDALTYAGSRSNLEDLPNADQHVFIHGDIRDVDLMDSIFGEYQIDTVVHFAAESHVDRSIDGPRDFIETNIIGTFNLLESVRKHWKNRQDVRFHHVSTDEVFGSLAPSDRPFSETTAYDPHSPYSASKAASDHLVRSYFHTYGLPISISNCSNNYGPYQYPEKLIPLMIFNALQRKALPIYGDGQQIRDWLYVEDHCAAIWDILTRGIPGETYTIGGGNQPTNLQLVKMICVFLDEMQPREDQGSYLELIEFVKDRPGHDRRYDIDTGKIEHGLGWAPVYELETGLEQTIRWYLAHTDWLKAISKDQAFNEWLDRHYSNSDDPEEEVI